MTKPKPYGQGVEAGRSEELGGGERHSNYHSAIKQSISHFLFKNWSLMGKELAAKGI